MKSRRQVGIEALGAAHPLARLEAGAEKFGGPDFHKAAEFGREPDIMQSEKVCYCR